MDEKTEKEAGIGGEGAGRAVRERISGANAVQTTNIAAFGSRSVRVRLVNKNCSCRPQRYVGKHWQDFNPAGN